MYKKTFLIKNCTFLTIYEICGCHVCMYTQLSPTKVSEVHSSSIHNVIKLPQNTPCTFLALSLMYIWCKFTVKLRKS